MTSPRGDFDHVWANRDDPRAWAADLVAHVHSKDMTEDVLTEWFAAAMQAAVVTRLGTSPEDDTGEAERGS